MNYAHVDELLLVTPYGSVNVMWLVSLKGRNTCYNLPWVLTIAKVHQPCIFVINFERVFAY